MKTGSNITFSTAPAISAHIAVFAAPSLETILFTAAYLSRLLGRGDKDTANKVASTAIYSGVSIGVVAVSQHILL